MLPIDHIPAQIGVLLPIGIMKTSNPLQFGDRIQSRRHELGVTQDSLASTIGVHRRVIGELERGKGTVRLEIALDAARALGLDVRLDRR